MKRDFYQGVVWPPDTEQGTLMEKMAMVVTYRPMSVLLILITQVVWSKVIKYFKFNKFLYFILNVWRWVMKDMFLLNQVLKLLFLAGSVCVLNVWP